MKKTLITILLLFTLTLAACSASKPSQPNYTDAPLPLASELVIGTFKLEGTANAVTVQEAAQLLPLWETYKDLSTSTSAAPQEVEALASQIQGAMTPAQVKAITDLKLTRKDMFQTMQDLGIASATRPNASGTPRPGGGGFPGGGGGGVPGTGGQGFNNNGQGLTPQQIATLQARRAQGGGSGQFSRIPSALFDSLIKLLQSKK
jgi:hypothetical protein